MQTGLPLGRKKPPPLWFVTNGETTVGPVRTDLLLRGLVHQRIPDDCLVRELRWRTWRTLDQVREIRALWSEQARGNSDAVAVARRPSFDAWQFVAPASDPGEVLLLSLAAAMRTTGALAGVCHRARDRSGRATISYAAGPGAHDLLGQSLSGSDPSIALAHAGHGIAGEPDAGPVQIAIFDRLGASALAGVLMAPVILGGDLLAVIELGRSDHAFRQRDAVALSEITIAAAARLISLG